MKMNFINQSEISRLKGNEIYSTIDENQSPIIREMRLSNALKFYNEAINLANNQHDLSSAYKNHSVICYGLYKLSKNIQTATYYMEETQNSSKMAVVYGKTKSEEWIYDIIIKSINAFVTFNNETISSLNNEEMKIDLLLKIRNKSSDMVIFLINYHLSNICYNNSLKLREVCLNKSYRFINECNYYYEECFKQRNQFLSSENIFNLSFNENDLNELNDSKLFQQCILEGHRAKVRADLLLDELLNNEESLDLEKVWDCVDLYREGIIKSRNKDIELEAEICSKLGLVYSKILKLDERAKKYYYESFNLAEAMKPKIFTTQSWYIRCCNAIKNYQKSVVEEENKKEEEERKKVQEEIAEDLKLIKSESEKNDRVSFIIFVYEKYPPKSDGKEIKKPNLNAQSTIEELKKAYKKALIHYHPDKNSGKNYGFAWHFTAAEISKNLGKFYEMLK